MFEKLLLLGIGYVLGARAGQEGLDRLVDQAKRLAQREDVRMMANVAMGYIEERAAAASLGKRMRSAA